MNDRFAAQLRQHLLESADERQADGHLARVIEGVAATSQRNPLAARLMWSPGRIGPIPTAVIRFGLIAAALAIAAVAGATMAGGARGPSTVFEGTWITIDPADGSGMTLVVGPGPAPDVYFEDGYASGLACRNDVVKRFTARGTGEISDTGLVLEATFPDGGGCGLLTVEVRGIYAHDEGADTLSDQDGGVWTRALDKRAEIDASLASPPPSSGPEAAQEPDASTAATTPPPDPECIQFDAPETYTAPVGSLSLGVTIPATPDTTWHGHPDAFFLTRNPCVFGGPWLDASLIGQVYADACDRTGTGVDVESPTAAIAALATQQGVVVDRPTSITVDGYAGARFDVAVADDVDPATCTDGVVQLFDGVANDLPATVVVVDVDGVALGLVFHGFTDDDAAVDRILTAEIDEILASTKIDP
jgi:hypothetical protein